VDSFERGGEERAMAFGSAGARTSFHFYNRGSVCSHHLFSPIK
jgi:hypothetical protein